VSHNFQEATGLVFIDLSYQELLEELWKRLEEFWLRKFPETKLTSEHVVLTWDNRVWLDENKLGIGPGFIRGLFFNKGKKGFATMIDPHKAAITIHVKVPCAIVEEAEQCQEDEEIENRKKV
jgi:hypothetical protein